jgi:hypothetical protein
MVNEAARGKSRISNVGCKRTPASLLNCPCQPTQLQDGKHAFVQELPFDFR